MLFIPVFDLVSNGIYQDRTFWGIRFPAFASPFDQPAIYVVKKDLEGRGHTVLNTCLERLDLALVVFAVKTETDWKSIEHKMCFDNTYRIIMPNPGHFF